MAILDAFDFDSDHMYRFSYNDRFGRTLSVDHPYIALESDNVLADRIKVGDLRVPRTFVPMSSTA